MLHKRAILLALLFIPLFAFSKTINPLDYGLLNANNGEERFWVLYNTHEIAYNNHWNVSYKGVDTIELEIPIDAKSIPLGKKTNFCGVTIVVTNAKKENFYLYILSQNTQQITISKELLDTYDFSSITKLRNGLKLLIIEDKNPWVENRAGHNYGAKRKDILLIKNGIAKNSTIAPYNNEYSSPSFKYTEVSKEKKVIKNINLRRTPVSSQKTYLVKVSNENNVLLRGISIYTPEPIIMTGDVAILFENCANITIKDVNIERTYSFDNKFGYGIALQNVWNVYFENIKSETAWGVFGNQDLNTVHGANSTINRFDAHCYARDFYFSNCEFSLVGLPQSSFMGDLEFKNCTFNYANVCASRIDYNAYTPFTITLKDCVIYMDKKHHTLVDLNNVPSKENARFELKKKYSPELNIINSTIVLSDDLVLLTLFQLGPGAEDIPFDVIGPIKVENLNVVGDNKRIMVFNKQISCKEETEIDLRGVHLANHKRNSIETNSGHKSKTTPDIILNISKNNL